MRRRDCVFGTDTGESRSRHPGFLLFLLVLVCVSSLRAQDVLTYHNDNARTGQALSETILTPSNVNSTQFGKLFQVNADGKVDAQPLYASAVTIPSQGTHNVLFVATEHDSVYALDADSGTQLWKVSLLPAGETPSDDRGCGQVSPEIGVTATPVIDRSSGSNGTIYVVAMSKDSSSAYHQRLHALDITSGAEEFGGPKEVQASFPGTGDNSNGTNVIFDPAQYKERPGLLLLSHVIYTSWSSHCDDAPYTAWIMAYNEATLNQVNVLDLTPNGHEGSLWMSGAGLAADSAGNIYPLLANGTFDTTLDNNGFPSQNDYGNAFVRLSTASGGLAVADYFTMSNTAAESNADEDLGSGGALVLPDMADANGVIRHLVVGAGKDQALYLADRDNMGKFNPTADNIYQELRSALPGGIFSMPAYFSGRLYFGPVDYNLIAFQFSNAKLQTTPVSSTSTIFAYPGATPSISANSSADAIVWATENTNPAVLHAYDASDLSKELYNSNQAGTRDQFGTGNKFITPTIANGKVYVGTTNGVGAFGLLSGPRGDFSVSVSSTGSTSVTVSPGQTAQYSLILTASGGFNQSVSFSCNGAPAEASCSVSPSSATPGNSATELMVSVSTTAPSQARNLTRFGPEGPLPGPSLEHAPASHPRVTGNPMTIWLWLVVAVLMAMLVARASGFGVRSLPMSLANSRGPQPLSPVLLVLGATVLAAALWASCGGGASGRMTNPGTPTGSYTLTVTGSSAYNSTTLTHSVTLQLVVN
jgi:outer membrane protein assembly factor BamB